MAVTDLANSDSSLSPAHHIPAELLLDYASGSLGEAWSLVVACHLTYCPHCRHELATIEAAAGVLVDDILPEPVAASSFSAVAARLGQQDAPPVRETPVEPAAASADTLPRPLQSYLTTRIETIPWRWSGTGLQSHALPMPKVKGGMVSLLKVAPGAGLPLHTHQGNEMTLILSGGYTNEHGAFRRGDVEFADGAVEHSPTAMADQPCVCLAVTDAPLSFRGRLGWFFNQWSKFSA